MRRALIPQVRGFLLNFGVYYAARDALRLDFAWNPALRFLAGFMTAFALAIAVTKVARVLGSGSCRRVHPKQLQGPVV
jgi:hypothetical protein